MKHQRYKVLIVEDSKTMLGLETDAIGSLEHIEVVTATSLAQTTNIIENQEETILCAILDPTLPDAPRGEVVDFVVSKNIPAIVYTGSIDEEIREDIVSRGAIDYVLKDGSSSLEYMSTLISYIYENQTTTVLVVDDSRTMLDIISSTLSSHRFTVLQARNGVDALEILKSNNNIKLIITDEYMPKMRGSELVREVRKLYGPKELSIIGVSAHGNSYMSVDFLKNGANDFITKPFRTEEFICRVLQSISMIRHVDVEKDRNRLLEENHEKDIQLLNAARHIALSELIANIAHHWRQPLNRLALDIQNLCLDFDENNLKRESVENFRSTSSKTIKEMSEMIDVFRGMFAQKNEEITFDISESIEMLVNTMMPTLKTSNISVFTSLNEAMITGYEEEFRHVIYGILMNSLNIFSDRSTIDPIIRIAVYKDDEDIKIVISDNGGGIESGANDKLFDPFFSTSPYYGRKGLGLFYAKLFIEKSFRGTITAENDEYGAVFTINCKKREEN